MDGIAVECRRKDGSIGAEIVRLIDFADADNNDWLVVNQFTVIEGQHNRRPDVVIFVNGLPLGVIELKNAADENADIWQAFQQLQTYKQQVPALFHPQRGADYFRRPGGAHRHDQRGQGTLHAVAHD